MSKPQRGHWVPVVGFVMSMTWVGAISWLMVEFASKAGCVIHFSAAVLGFTFIALGMRRTLPSSTLSQDDLPQPRGRTAGVFDIRVGREGRDGKHGGVQLAGDHRLRHPLRAGCPVVPARGAHWAGG